MVGEVQDFYSGGGVLFSEYLGNITTKNTILVWILRGKAGILAMVTLPRNK